MNVSTQDLRLAPNRMKGKGERRGDRERRAALDKTGKGGRRRFFRRNVDSQLLLTSTGERGNQKKLPKGPGTGAGGKGLRENGLRHCSTSSLIEEGKGWKHEDTISINGPTHEKPWYKGFQEDFGEIELKHSA